MPSLLALQGAASLIVGQPALPAATPAKPLSSANTVVAVANGLSPEQFTGTDNVSAQARKKVSEALFDAQRPNIVTLKAQLVQRVAASLGVTAENYPTNEEYTAALGAAFRELMRQPNADSIIAEMEKDLGLDKLGISLKTVIRAVVDDDPSAQEELDAALKKYAAESEKNELRMGAASLYLR